MTSFPIEYFHDSKVARADRYEGTAATEAEAVDIHNNGSDVVATAMVLEDREAEAYSGADAEERARAEWADEIKAGWAFLEQRGKRGGIVQVVVRTWAVSEAGPEPEHAIGGIPYSAYSAPMSGAELREIAANLWGRKHGSVGHVAELSGMSRDYIERNMSADAVDHVLARLVRLLARHK